ncbi:hypothetical protein [Candidatus Mycoplasma haematohominis]|uniref:hypothetical protein n=1 Tax=Candidatus Mycoplasma haematohominis TaxID=1494318 RepID=UPI001C0A711C|nr:hypothetical protein [Candidatus Mycoplasma haemohominis]
MSVAKVASAAALATGVLGGGGYLIYDNLIDTETRLLAYSSDFEKTYTDANSFGRKYGIYLLDPDSSKNKDVWSALFNKWSKDKETKDNNRYENFKKTKIDKSFGADNKALNQVCKSSFKEANFNNKDKYEENIWAFCSIFEAKPKMVSSSETTYSNKFGTKAEHNGKLVSVKSEDDTSNNSFWDRRNKEFFGEVRYGNLGSKASNESIFKTLYNKKDRGANDTVKKTCEIAYSTTTTSPSNKFTDADLKLFCYLIPEKTSQ